MSLKAIYGLLTKEERRRGVWVALSVLVRALLDFAGVAALIPILITVFGERTDVRTSLLVCGLALAFVLLKNVMVIFLARFQSGFLLHLYQVFSRKMFCNYYHRGLLFQKSKSSVQLAHEVNFVCYTFSLCILSPIFRIAGEALLLLLMVTALMLWEPMIGALLCFVFMPIVMSYVWMVKGRLRQYGTEELAMFSSTRGPTLVTLPAPCVMSTSPGRSSVRRSATMASKSGWKTTSEPGQT